MAQGSGVKGKSSKFVLPSKVGSSNKGNKSGGTKKGVKKAKVKESAKIKKNLQKAIGRRIEEELVTIAADKGNNFKILNSSGKSSSKKKTTTK